MKSIRVLILYIAGGAALISSPLIFFISMLYLGNSRNFVDVVEAIAILIVGVFFVVRFARWMFREARDLRAEIVNEIHAEKKETKL